MERQIYQAKWQKDDWSGLGMSEDDHWNMPAHETTQKKGKAEDKDGYWEQKQ